MLAFQGGLFLSYRWRNGDKARGELLEIAVDSGDLLFRNIIKRFKKTDYGYWSFEKSSFATNGEEVAFLYCADTGGTWKIFKCVSQSPLEIDLPGKVLISNAKDPAIFYDSSKESYVIVYSDLRKLGHDLVVATSRDLKQLTTLSEGLAWNQFAAQDNRWAKTHIHAGHISKIGKYYVLLYDTLPRSPSCFGSGWLGVAISANLRVWIDLTPDNSLWTGHGPDRTFRYVTIDTSAGRYALFAEEEGESGRKDLVVYTSQF